MTNATSAGGTMSRIAGSETEVVIGDLRRRFVPLISTIFAMLLGLLPIISSTLWIPNLAFMTLLTWRLVRPEIWQAQVALGWVGEGVVMCAKP